MGIIKQLKPVAVPDDFMNWSHPDMHLIDPLWNNDEERGYTSEEFESLKNNGGVDIWCTNYWYEDIPEIPEDDGGNWANWKPEAPKSGYFLIGAYDTEYGPFLWWAKERN